MAGGAWWVRAGLLRATPDALQSFKDDVDLKQDLRCDTIDTREEYEMKVGRGRGKGLSRGLGAEAVAGGGSRGLRMGKRAGREGQDVS